MKVVLQGRILLDQLVELRLVEKQPHRWEVVMGDGKHSDPCFIGNENWVTLYEDDRRCTTKTYKGNGSAIRVVAHAFEEVVPECAIYV